MNSSLWAKLALVMVIPATSLLLSDMADLASRNRADPYPSAEATYPTEFVEHHYHDHFCQDEREVDWDIWETYRLTSNNLFEVGAHRPNHTHQGFREYKCTDGVIESFDYAEDDKTSEVRMHLWWLNSYWAQFAAGECAATKWGSHRLVPAFPKELYAHLFPCITRPDEVKLELYDADTCTAASYNHQIESRRLTTAGGTCIDVAHQWHHRYNNQFVCERHALVEKYHEGHEGCEGTQVDHENIWPFYKWRAWVRGECTHLSDVHAIKFDKPMFDESVIHEVSKLPCANIMAQLSTYKDSQCQDLQSTIELVDGDSGTNCIHATGHFRRLSTKHCFTAGQDSVNMALFDSEDCSGNVSKSFYVEKNMYTFLGRGLCVEGRNTDGQVKYFKMGLPDNIVTRFPVLSACEN